ncbi:MAG: DEAD-box ATP-dependent RNA helicase RhpA [Chlamydiae bacterium]|nr:DEAD-box ATP-dependent RNA helicase RhpA [Chlamydiota bacterium]
MISPLELLPNTYRVFFGGFPSLTIAQNELIHPILQERDIVLQESTGAGKTEAVLAPATENLITHRESYTIVYIVPTRALALDMIRRIKPLYKQLGLKAGIRTGDGKTLLDAKPDLLIMTPESLDVLLGSNNQSNQHFTKHIHVMIVDEVHVFIHNDRGHQLSYLRKRLERQSLAPLQTVALSATLADPNDIVRLLDLKKNVFSYKQSATHKLQPCWVHLKDLEHELSPFFDDLYLHWGCKKILAFANTRRKCEEVHHLLNKSGLFSQKLWIHYSNLSTKERRSIESSFRKSKMGVCIATTTLELGIDIGDVGGVVLIGPPPSSMAFLQRIGRGNRREQHKSFWGICQGANTKLQLIKFLALHELAKENQVEALPPFESYSVLLQQILSCLYAKKRLSIQSLQHLFTKKSEELHEIFHHMLANKWLKPTKHPGLYEGGWRYYAALKKRQIWSNFPPTNEEYDVILERKKIATIPFSTLKQFELGDLIQLTGKTLRILEIKKEETTREVWVEQSNQIATKELFWVGFGAPTSFEVAQKMQTILSAPSEHPGLLNRTHRLLEKARENMDRSIEQPSGMRIHRTENRAYRYETFLGTVGNFILYHLVKTQLAEKIDGLSVSFDELGIEGNQQIPFHTLKIPHTSQQLQQWVSLHLSLLRASFPWNNWLHWLPEKHQQREIYSRLHDPRVLQTFHRYHLETKWFPLPEDDKNAAHPTETYRQG